MVGSLSVHNIRYIRARLDALGGVNGGSSVLNLDIRTEQGMFSISLFAEDADALTINFRK